MRHVTNSTSRVCHLTCRRSLVYNDLQWQHWPSPLADETRRPNVREILLAMSLASALLYASDTPVAPGGRISLVEDPDSVWPVASPW